MEENKENKINKVNKKPVRELPKRIDSQLFIMYNDKKIDSIFPIPVNAVLPKFQRTIGMAEGTILSADEKGNGFIEIDGIEYQLKENRNRVMQKRYPLSKYIGQKIKFSFYPTITLKGIKILGLQPNDKPFIKINKLRKNLEKQGAIEVIGNVKYIGKEHFTIGVWSSISKKEYLINISANLRDKVNVKDFVKADCILKDGLIKLEEIKIFKFDNEVK